MDKELLIPVGIIVLSLVFLDPSMRLMPATLVYTLLALLFTAALIYCLLIWREHPLDEREIMMRAYAARVSFIVGVAILVGSIIYQVLYVHEVDPLLVAVLVGMTLAKYTAHRYAQSKY